MPTIFSLPAWCSPGRLFLVFSITLLGILYAPASIAQQIFINEFVAKNDSGLKDESGDLDDWIEIYNGGTTAVDLGGMFITDDLTNPTLWQIPTTNPDLTTIQPGGFLILWADWDTLQSPLHINMKLSANGEQIGLARMQDSEIIFIDSVTFGPQDADVSYGRYPDGTDNWGFLKSVTPGAKNTPSTSSVDELADLHLQLYPNPVSQTLTVTLDDKPYSKIHIRLFDLTGQLLYSAYYPHVTPLFQTPIDVSQFVTGLYFIEIEVPGHLKTRKKLLISQ